MDNTTPLNVFHKEYGCGKIIKTTDKKVYVDFGGKNRIFEYPSAFDKGYLVADDTVEIKPTVSETKGSVPSHTKELPKISPVALTMDDIKHHIMAVNINKRYKKNLTSQELYDAVRGLWRASWKRVQEIEYVFGFYDGVIVAVYMPTKWFICKEAPKEFAKFKEELTPRVANRVFFVDTSFEQGLPSDENQKFYIGKSLLNLDINVKSQNPVTYLSPRDNTSTI